MGWETCLGRAWGPRGSTPPLTQPRSRRIGVQGCSPEKSLEVLGRPWVRAGDGALEDKRMRSFKFKKMF